MDLEKDLAKPELEEDGVWVDYKDGAKFKLARLGNKKFLRAYETKRRPHLKAIRKGNFSADDELRISCEVLAETVVMDWDGILVGGKKVKYTPDLGFKYFYQSRDLRDDITEMADDAENFMAEVFDDAAGN